MKKYTILAVLLAAILAVPAFAQSNSATQTPAATPSATRPDTATGKDPLQPETREGFWGRANRSRARNMLRGRPSRSATASTNSMN